MRLSDIAYRNTGTSDYTVTQSWAVPYVPGLRYINKDVYILTSHGTFSGPEEFDYSLQALKRATVVGETTAGGANPGSLDRLNDYFQVLMPQGRAINPITNTNWEAVGVKPDIAVSADDALVVAE